MDQAVVQFGYPEFWPTIYAQHSAFFSAATEIEQLANDMFKLAEARATQPVQKLVYLLARITTIGFWDVLLLAANGSGVGAMKIGRGLFESSVQAEYLRRNPTEADDYVDFGRVLAWRRYEWLLKESPAEASKISLAKAEGLRDEYQRVKPKFEDSKGRVRLQWSKKTIAQMAREIGRDDQYDLAYSLGASMHHVNAEGLLAYVDASQPLLLYDAPPSMAWVAQALVSAHVYVLLVLDTLNDCCNLGFDERLKKAGEALVSVWRTDASAVTSEALC
jgi:hypothetical protein